ncbi:MAG TPA: GNAT family N-acetyltransferase [Ktedonobacterales bacterium]|nr:GNAT family N-acetyltransferase [Ktedonobacterales bacterium]
MVQPDDALKESAAATLHVTALCDSEAFETLRGEWEALLERAPRATAFQCPDWLATSWRLSHGRQAIQLLSVRDDAGEMVGIMPLRYQHYGRWPWRLRVLRWLGQDKTGLTETLGPVFAAGYETAAMRAVLTYLGRGAREWDILELPRTPEPLALMFRDWTQEMGYKVMDFAAASRLYIHLAADWSSLQRTLSKNLRSNLARCRNRLDREGHVVSFSMLADPEAIVAALPRFFELHRMRSEAAEMKQHNDYFPTQANRDFVVEMARILAPRQRLLLAQMEVDGAVVATQLLLFQSQTMSAYYSGFDPQWRQYSVMTLLTRACVEYAIARGMSWVDLTEGSRSQAKRQWGNEELMSYHVLIARPPLLTVLAARALLKWYATRARRDVRPSSKGSDS